MSLKRPFLVLASVIVTLLLLGSSVLAEGPTAAQPTKSDPVYLDELHSPLERPGTWKGNRKPWSSHQTEAPTSDDLAPQGIWWGGWYMDWVSNTLLENNVHRGFAEAFKMLGRGVCMDVSESTSMTGTLSLNGGYKFSNAIRASFGFSASGTRTFTQTYKYCGPWEDSDNQYRYFYKQLIYNRYRSDVTRCFWRWDGSFLGCESGTSTVEVPYMATFSQDSHS